MASFEKCRIVSNIMKDKGIASLDQLSIFILLYEKGPLSLKSISETVEQARSTVVTIVARFEKRGLLCSTEDPAELNRALPSKIVKLTDEGKNLIESILSDINK